MSSAPLETALEFFLSHYHLKLFTQPGPQSISSICLKRMLRLSCCTLGSSSAAEAMASTEAVTKQPSSPMPPSTPPSSPVPCLLGQMINSEHLRTVLEKLKLAQPIQNVQPSTVTSEASNSAEVGKKPEHEKLRIRASKLEYKTVNEMYVRQAQKHCVWYANGPFPLSWDKEAYKHKIVESFETESKVDKYEEYLFIIRRQFGMLLTSSEIQLRH